MKRLIFNPRLTVKSLKNGEDCEKVKINKLGGPNKGVKGGKFSLNK